MGFFSQEGGFSGKGNYNDYPRSGCVVTLIVALGALSAFGYKLVEVLS